MFKIHKGTIKKIIKYPIIQAFFINLLVFIVLLLVFNPIQKSDDYYLSEIIYGAVSGEYDIHLVYNHVLLGYIMKSLLLIFPNVAWYTVLQVILVFLAFVVLTHYVLKYYQEHHSWSICLCLLFVFGYECYVKVTFTKTAAVLVAIGLFFLLKGIWGERKNIWYCTIGIMQIFWGMLFRIAVVNSVLAIMAGIFIVEAVWILIERKRINAKVILGVCAFVLLQVANTGLGAFNKYVYSMDEEWSQYFYINDIKSKIIDYTQNEYDRYKDQYLEIGLSENDLKMIYNNEMYDSEVMTEEKLLNAISIVQQGARNLSLSSMLNLKNIVAFTKTVPLVYVSIFCFSAFLFLSFMALMHPTKKELLCWGWVILMMLGENYYLFLKGRVLQSHVDMGIIFSACLALIYFMEYKTKEEAEINKQISILVATVLIVCNLTSKYKDFTSNSFVDYGSEAACNIELNEKSSEVISTDTEHLYLINGQETIFSRWQIDAYEIIPKGYYSNIYSLSSYIWPSHRKVMETYNIDNPYRQIIDSDNIYFLVSDFIEENSVERMNIYIQEHYNEEARLVKVKEINTVNIYVCVTPEKELKQYPTGAGITEKQIEIDVSEGDVNITGYYYVKDNNSYKQDVYLKIYNTQTQKSEIFYALKKENILCEDIMNGKYSCFEVTIPKSEYESEDNIIDLIVIADGECYEEQIMVKSGKEHVGMK